LIQSPLPLHDVPTSPSEPRHRTQTLFTPPSLRKLMQGIDITERPHAAVPSSQSDPQHVIYSDNNNDVFEPALDPRLPVSTHVYAQPHDVSHHSNPLAPVLPHTSPTRGHHFRLPRDRADHDHHSGSPSHRNQNHNPHGVSPARQPVFSKSLASLSLNGSLPSLASLPQGHGHHEDGTTLSHSPHRSPNKLINSKVPRVQRPHPSHHNHAPINGAHHGHLSLNPPIVPRVTGFHHTHHPAPPLTHVNTPRFIDRDEEIFSYLDPPQHPASSSSSSHKTHDTARDITIIKPPLTSSNTSVSDSTALMAGTEDPLEDNGNGSISSSVREMVGQHGEEARGIMPLNEA
jgi:hypothetical protein